MVLQDLFVITPNSFDHDAYVAGILIFEDGSSAGAGWADLLHEREAMVRSFSTLVEPIGQADPVIQVCWHPRHGQQQVRPEGHQTHRNLVRIAANAAFALYGHMCGVETALQGRSEPGRQRWMVHR